MGNVKNRLIEGYYCTDCGKHLGKPEEKEQRCCMECENFKQSLGDSLRAINTAFNAVENAFRKKRIKNVW
jgi:hypothetical protein